MRSAVMHMSRLGAYEQAAAAVGGVAEVTVMRVGEPCPFCNEPLTHRVSRAPRNGGRVHYVYCAHDQAAWEITPPVAPIRDFQTAPSRDNAQQNWG